MSATTHAREPIENATEERKLRTSDRVMGGARNSGDGAAAERGSRGVRGRRTGATPRTRERSARATVTDSALLNFLIVVLGFGLCRAWIVFCLGAPLVFPAASPTHWIYLASGALCAAVVALVCRAGGNTIALMRRLLFRITPFALLASGILIPLAIRANSELPHGMRLCGRRHRRGPLQVLWGDRFSAPLGAVRRLRLPGGRHRHGKRGRALGEPDELHMGFIVVPLLSFGLLVFHADRTGHPWRELVGKSDLDSSWDSAPQSAVAEPAEAARRNRQASGPAAAYPSAWASSCSLS